MCQQFVNPAVVAATAQRAAGPDQLHRARPDRHRHAGRFLDEAARQRMSEATPLKRIGRPEEMAEPALFLLCERASCTTGQSYIAGGGRVSPLRAGGRIGLDGVARLPCCRRRCQPVTRGARMASIVVRKLSDATKERLRQRAVRHERSLEAEVRAILERAAQEAGPSDAAERFPDWFIRMTRPGIDLDAAIEENRLPHEA
jgi:plasmid stability protein